MATVSVIHFTLNGEQTDALCSHGATLLQLLRNRLHLTATKDGCSNGNCGACTVLLDGDPVNACLVLAIEANSRSVVTVEGIAHRRQLHPLQEAFLEEGAVQCGFCTPGIIVAAKALLDREPQPTEQQVRRWLSGNLCRCTGYDKIIRAVLAAANVLQTHAVGYTPVTHSHLRAPGGPSAQLHAPYKVLGTRPIRHDGIDKVTGRAVFGADIRLPRMLVGRILRSPHAHARISAINVSRAAALPGVKAVITAVDFPGCTNPAGTRYEKAAAQRELRDNILASSKVLYHGHAVAAVAAIDEPAAEHALRLIEVNYEPLTAVLDVRAAMRQESPLLDETRHTDSLSGWSKQPSNVASQCHFEVGDVERGFRQADIILEHEYRTCMVHQGYLEPPTATALWDADDNLTVWTSTQGAFSARDEISEILDHPVGRIRVIPLEIGGGFGGKLSVHVEPVAALLSRKTGQPVQLTMARAELFEGTGPAPGTSIVLRMGATKEGSLVAAQADLAYEAGAFPGSAVSSGCQSMLAPCNIPNMLIDGYDVVVNKPKSEAYRAPGAPQAAFAAESMVDEMAEALGIDPLEFRLKNASRAGTHQANGFPFRQIGNEECIKAAIQSDHYRSSPGEATDGKRRGRGVASGFWFNAGMASSAIASVNTDGTVSLVEGSVDLGGTRTSVAMQLAETLGIPVEMVRPSVGDTDSIGYTDATGGSRTTFATGWAAYEAAMDIRRQLIQRAAPILGTSADDLLYEDGIIRSRSHPGKKQTFQKLAALLEAGVPIIGRGAVNLGHAGPGFGIHIVDVDVDLETGKVEILRYTAVQDAGTAVHPSYVEGQMQGGVAQGIGWALNEAYDFDAVGQMRNATFLDYRVPTASDLPWIETIVIEVPDPGHPYGVRGVGEVPIVPPLAAVANALYSAVGVRFRQLPMSPGRILEAVRGRA